MSDDMNSETKTTDTTKEEKKAPLTSIVAVRLETPGVKACGQFKHGEVYKVGDDLALEEAHRLVDVKGFKKLSAAQVIAAEKEAVAAKEKT